MSTRHDSRLACRDHIYMALVDEMGRRDDDDNWEDRERVAVADAATAWSNDNRVGRPVSVDDVKRVEGSAVGHVDYASKLALYVAELVVTR